MMKTRMKMKQANNLEVMLKEMVEMEGIRDKQIGGREGKRIK